VCVPVGCDQKRDEITSFPEAADGINKYGVTQKRQDKTS
jgi:hypothetical protein